MEQVVIFGLAIAIIMLGVPTWYAVGRSQKGHAANVFRWWFVCGVILIMSVVCGLIFAAATLVLMNTPTPRISRVATDCTILSSGVDLRATKMCSPPLHSDSAHVMGVRSAFRCYFEYYWASVFRVELKPSVSGLPVQVATEIPREALPAHCRPGFGTIWDLKGKYQVNKTYPCKFIPGKLESLEIIGELFMHCKSEELTIWKLMAQVSTTFFSEWWIFSSTNPAAKTFWKTLVSVSVGACYSMLVAGVARGVRRLRLVMIGSNQFSDSMYFEVIMQLCVFIVTYFVFWYSAQNQGPTS